MLAVLETSLFLQPQKEGQDLGDQQLRKDHALGDQTAEVS